VQCRRRQSLREILRINSASIRTHLSGLMKPVSKFRSPKERLRPGVQWLKRVRWELRRHPIQATGHTHARAVTPDLPLLPGFRFSIGAPGGVLEVFRASGRKLVRRAQIPQPVCYRAMDGMPLETTAMAFFFQLVRGPSLETDVEPIARLNSTQWCHTQPSPNRPESRAPSRYPAIYPPVIVVDALGAASLQVGAGSGQPVLPYRVSRPVPVPAMLPDGNEDRDAPPDHARSGVSGGESAYHNQPAKPARSPEPAPEARSGPAYWPQGSPTRRVRPRYCPRAPGLLNLAGEHGEAPADRDLALPACGVRARRSDPGCRGEPHAAALCALHAAELAATPPPGGAFRFSHQAAGTERASASLARAWISTRPRSSRWGSRWRWGFEVCTSQVGSSSPEAIHLPRSFFLDHPRSPRRIESDLAVRTLH
jgi:hypothetical protein